MARIIRRPVHTHTITFPERYRVGEGHLDDPRVAERFARRMGCEHQTIVVEPDVTDLLPKITWHMDEPTADPAIIAAFLVCREARGNTTVLLSGVGGDELFAGTGNTARITGERPTKRFLPFAASVYRTADTRNAELPRYIAFKGNDSPGQEDGSERVSLPAVERFLMNCTYMDAKQLENLLTPAISRAVKLGTRMSGTEPASNKVDHADFLNQMLYVDTKIFMTSLNLTYADKMSMASSVEVRVPFLTGA